jgi:hypothetical protein
MWHCNVNASSLVIRAGESVRKMSANGERIGSREGARGVQTLYMTETMQINRSARDPGS